MDLKYAQDKFQEIHLEKSEFFNHAVAAVILNWLRHEKELTCLTADGESVVWSRWIILENLALQDFIKNEDPNYVSDTFNELIAYAVKVSSLAFEEGMPLFTFMKDIGVIGTEKLIDDLESAEIVGILLCFLEILKDIEPNDVKEKYERDIHKISKVHFVGTGPIEAVTFDSMKVIAKNFYSKERDFLQKQVQISENNKTGLTVNKDQGKE